MSAMFLPMIPLVIIGLLSVIFSAVALLYVAGGDTSPTHLKIWFFYRARRLCLGHEGGVT
jgi:hypothetical protein